MSKRVLISIVVLVIAACLVLSVLAVVGVLSLVPVSSTVSTVETQATPNGQTPTGQIPAGPASTPVGQPSMGTPQASSEAGVEIPADALNEMHSIEKQVEANRGLSLSGEITRTLLTPDQLRQRVIDEFLKDYTPEDMAVDQKVMNVFGLLPRDFDIKTLYTNLYSEQIAGYYDDKTNEMVVVQGQGFNGPERETYAHEFTHALQDSAYDLTNGLKTDEETCRKDSEYCAAVQSLIEGDATLSEQLWLYNDATQKDRDQIDEYYRNYKSPVYDSAPDFLKEDFLFPYDKGVNFVLGFYQQGGYPAVDKLYKNLPVSTEQIMHPERYPNDAPLKVDLPDFSAALGADWKEIERNNVGEWYTYLILAYGNAESYRLNQDQASKAAEGWGGDTYAVYSGPKDGDVALVYLSKWDTDADSQEFWQAFQEYAKDRWGKPSQSGSDRLEWSSTDTGAVLVEREANGQVLWVVAPDAQTIDTLVGQIPQ